jgi:hypothetical protein
MRIGKRRIEVGVGYLLPNVEQIVPTFLVRQVKNHVCVLLAAFGLLNGEERYAVFGVPKFHKQIIPHLRKGAGDSVRVGVLAWLNQDHTGSRR